MKQVRTLFRESMARRRHTVANGAYAVAEYVSLPLGLLLSAPYLLRHMGAAQFGVWVLATSVVNGGNSLSTGFGDAAIKYVAMYRGQGDLSGVARIIRGMISINLMLSAAIACTLWLLAPFAATHIAHIDASTRDACRQSFQIGALLLVVRSIDSVFASTLRAFEQYGPPVRISIFSRVAALVGAVMLVARGYGVVEIMWFTLGITALAAAAQGWTVRSATGKTSLLPSLNPETLKLIAGFGCFSWLQALSAVLFGQADRLVIGVILGSPAVAAYALCDQAAQTIHGEVAAGFHVLFPHLSARIENESFAAIRRTLISAFKSNVALAALLGVPAIFFSRPILAVWMDHDFAQQSWPMLSILGAGSMLLALNVTAYYGLLATGRIRLVMSVNLAAGVAMLLSMILLTPHFGTVGTACGWLIAGPITCVLYLPLWRMFRGQPVVCAKAVIIPAMENN